MPGARRSLTYGLLFAVALALLSFQGLAFRTFLWLFYAEGGQLIQQPIPEGLPIPVGLAWSPGLRQLISAIAVLPAPAVLGLHIALYGVLGYGLLQLVNPTFRLTTGVDWDRALLTRTYMHTQPLIKAFLIGVAALVPAFLMWQAIGGLLPWRLALFVQAALVGAATWLLLGREGVAGDMESGNYVLPTGRSVVASLVARGALAGLAACAGALAIAPARPEPVLLFLRSLSGIGEVTWLRAAAICCGVPAAVGLCLGFVLHGLGSPALTPAGRVRQVAPGALGLLVIGLAAGLACPALQAARYDYRPGANTATRLARAAGLPAPSGRQVEFLLLDSGQAVFFRSPEESAAGLDVGSRADARIAAFLRQRRYATALSGPAFETLFDSAALRWDRPAMLETAYTNLARCPDPIYMAILLEQLAGGPATEDAIRVADRLGEAGAFTFLDRDAAALVGDLQARFGRREAAVRWYRRAGIPPSRVEERLARMMRFVSGTVTGSLVIDGRPAAGASVGLLAARSVRTLMREAPPGVPTRPFAWRMVVNAAAVARDGTFGMQGVVAGEYRLVIRLPRPPAGSGAPPVLVGATAPVVVIDDGTRRASVGAIVLRRARPAPSGGGA